MTVAVTVATAGAGGELHGADADEVDASPEVAEADVPPMAAALNASNVWSWSALAANTMPAVQCAGGPGCLQYTHIGLVSLTVIVCVGKLEFVPGGTGMLGGRNRQDGGSW